jgi:ketosteroid isomerase-like protein
MTDIITLDKVKSAVAAFWALWKKKSADGLVNLYSSNSTAFRVESTRLEPSILVARARAREYLHSSSNFEIDLGPVEVTMLGTTAAIATYVFTFRAQQRAKPNVLGVTSQEHSKNVRATQVLEVAADGVLRIVHEHFSLPSIT